MRIADRCENPGTDPGFGPGSGSDLDPAFGAAARGNEHRTVRRCEQGRIDFGPTTREVGRIRPGSRFRIPGERRKTGAVVEIQARHLQCATGELGTRHHFGLAGSRQLGPGSGESLARKARIATQPGAPVLIER